MVRRCRVTSSEMETLGPIASITCKFDNLTLGASPLTPQVPRTPSLPAAGDPFPHGTHLATPPPIWGKHARRSPWGWGIPPPPPGPPPPQPASRGLPQPHSGERPTLPSRSAAKMTPPVVFRRIVAALQCGAPRRPRPPSPLCTHSGAGARHVFPNPRSNVGRSKQPAS